MGKTDITKKLELDIWKATQKQGLFGCFEVTIGWFGKERVDYITYDTKDVWRCYEIKISKSDFHSKSHNTFMGNFNYYVMTRELFEAVKSEIPNHVGVYIEGDCIKKAKRQTLKVDEQILKNSMIRSLYREYQKILKSEDSTLIENKNKHIRRLERERLDITDKYYKLLGEKYV